MDYVGQRFGDFDGDICDNGGRRGLRWREGRVYVKRVGVRGLGDCGDPEQLSHIAWIGFARHDDDGVIAPNLCRRCKCVPSITAAGCMRASQSAADWNAAQNG
jgi:hypothetical protein